MTPAQRRAKLLARARELTAEHEAEESAEVRLLARTRGKITFEQFRSMFKTLVEAHAYVRDEFGVRIPLPASTEERDWREVYDAAVHAESARANDPRHVASFAKPRQKQVELSREERAWLEARQQVEAEDSQAGALGGGGPKKYGSVS